MLELKVIFFGSLNFKFKEVELFAICFPLSLSTITKSSFSNKNILKDLLTKKYAFSNVLGCLESFRTFD